MLDRSRPDPIRAPELSFASGHKVRHGFFTRQGGVSEGLYRGLNIGVGSNDAPAAVQENRARVAAAMGVAPGRLIGVYQIHSPTVATVTGPFEGERPKADAMVTDRRGLALGISTADCGPVLFADPAAGVIGAAHAGWKGAVDGVLEATVDAMTALGAEAARIVAVLGPSITQPNYEVGPEFVARLLAQDRGNERWFRPSARESYALFDLNGYTVDRLARTGVRASMLGRCTYAEEGLFFSYRRATHRKEADYGRQISAIVLEET